MKSQRRIRLFLLLALSLHQGAGAETYTVYNAGMLTQAVAFAASNGQDDVINLVAGRYELDATVVFDSSEPCSLTMRNRYGEVVLDAGSRRILYIWSRANDTNAWVRLEGLTFQNAFITEDFGAGTFIRTQRGHILVERCLFRDCRSSSLYNASHAAGAYLCVENSGTLRLRRCSFLDNDCKGSGGGAYLTGPDIALDHNLFVGNIADARGGGAYIYAINGQVAVHRNTFVGNRTGASGWGGGGLHVRCYGDSGNVALLNNLFRTNIADHLLGEDLFIEDDADANGTGVAVQVTANLLADFDYTQGDNIVTNLCFNADPMLGTGLRLTANSPCIDEAIANEYALDHDLSLYSVALDGNDDGVPIADIGAWEYIPSSAYTPMVTACWQRIYASSNLATHGISFECSPGDPATNCPCGTADVALVVHDHYAEVQANTSKQHYFINAIAYQRFMNTFPGGAPIALNIFKYRAEARLPVLPAPDVTQTQNAQTVQMMIQMWDGDNQVWQADKNAIEATVYWTVNAWESNYQGNVLVYTGSTGDLEMVETGIHLPVNTNWHSFEMTADFANRRWISLRVDETNLVDLSSIRIPLLLRTNWGPELLYHLTQESCSAYPGPGYPFIFTATTEFRNIEFSRLVFPASIRPNPTNPVMTRVQWPAAPFLKYGISVTEDGLSWAIQPGWLSGHGANLRRTVDTTNVCRWYRIEVDGD